jgi:hypothetical protein
MVVQNDESLGAQGKEILRKIEKDRRRSRTPAVFQKEDEMKKKKYTCSCEY